MSHVVLDDHLLRDLLADDIRPSLDRLLAEHSVATTNLYLVRLSRSLVSASGGALTGSWPTAARRELARRLVMLGDDCYILPMRLLAFRMAELAMTYRLSTLGAEAVAAAEHLRAPLCVWSGDDGPRIRAAMAGVGIKYQAIDA